MCSVGRGQSAGRAGAGNAAEPSCPREWRQRGGEALSMEGTRGLALSGEQSPIPPPTSTRTCSHVPFPSAALGWAAAPGLEAPSAPRPALPARAVLTSSCEAARPGRRARPDPTGSAAGPSWGAGPPLAGRGAGRQGGFHESRALRNLGLKETPGGGGGGGGGGGSGGSRSGGSSCALRPPARGGVCLLIPPPHSPPHSPPPPVAGPPPTRPRPPPASLRRAERTSPRGWALALPPLSRSPLGLHPPRPPSLSEPCFLHRKEEMMGA